ncbi:hypothetical protein ACWGB8_15135 [Kitasatospora sp. NPDC054939]
MPQPPVHGHTSPTAPTVPQPPVHAQTAPTVPQPPVHAQQNFPPQAAQTLPLRPQPSEPDWAALADRNEADRKRKGRMRIIGAVVGVAVVGALVAGGLVLLNNNGSDEAPKAGPTAAGTASGTATGSAAPKPAPTPEDPSKPLWEAATDPARQDAATLFASPTVTVDGATWNRTAVSLDAPCWDGNSTVGGLGKVLGDQGCRQVLRATYVSGGSAVTVGVAVFDSKQQAETSMKSHVGHLKGLAAPGSPAYCAAPGCTNTKATLGRYAYLTVEGSAKGGNGADPVATQAAAGFADYVKGRLLERAKEAGGAAGSSAASPAATAGATPAG